MVILWTWEQCHLVASSVLHHPKSVLHQKVQQLVVNWRICSCWWSYDVNILWILNLLYWTLLCMCQYGLVHSTHQLLALLLEEGAQNVSNNRFSRSRWIGSELRIAVCWIVAARIAAQFSLRRCRRHSRQRRWRQIRFDPQICEKLLNLLVEIRLWRRENFKNGHRENWQFWGDFDGKSWIKISLKNT